jgi:replicative DNA helicase
LRDKHIPTTYLRASERQRRALLAGLMDTSGTVAASGRCRYRSRSHRLAEDVRELVLGLGYSGVLTARAVTFTTTDDIFRVERKAALHKERRRATGADAGSYRSIVDVRTVASRPVKCVSVDNTDKLYLAGRTLIPTHNSTASMDFARTRLSAATAPARSSRSEMSKIEIVMRLLSAEARCRCTSCVPGSCPTTTGPSWPGGWARSARRRSSSTTHRA